MIDAREREELIVELRRLHACLRPPRMRGAGQQWMDLDISIPQLKVMFLLLDAQPARMSFIAQELGVTLPACTHLVDRLVAAGYVQRSEDPTDRRVVQCSLTAPGKDALDKLRQQSPFEQEGFIKRLSIDELKVCVEAAKIYQRVIADMSS